jgi:hypothetical protein
MSGELARLRAENEKWRCLWDNAIAQRDIARLDADRMYVAARWFQAHAVGSLRELAEYREHADAVAAYAPGILRAMAALRKASYGAWDAIADPAEYLGSDGSTDSEGVNHHEKLA